MGTKNNPGDFDCYANAEPDEPMFVLLGRDPTAFLIVSIWHAVKKEMRDSGTSKISDEKLDEARACAIALKEWAKKQGKNTDAADAAFNRVVHRMIKDLHR